MTTRFISNITLDDKKYHLVPALEFEISEDGQYFCANNETLSIMEYETTENRACEEARRSFERRCRFYRTTDTEFTEDQLKMKEIFSGLEFEEGNIDEESLNSSTTTGTDIQSTIKVEMTDPNNISRFPAIPQQPVLSEYTTPKGFAPEEVSSDYCRGFIEGYDVALKEWKEIVVKLIEKME